MSKKQDAFYFQNFIDCADCACQAAHLLEKIMLDFDPNTVRTKLDEMHEIEHAADAKKHKLLDVLVKAFITPIERDDILRLSQNIDEMTDRLEDVLIRIYFNRVRAIRPDALELVRVVIRCYEEVQTLLREFADFKHSKKLREHIIQINSLEEEADRLFISCMYDLHESGAELPDIIAWREVYMYLEKCADASEHVADVVESVVMNNS